MGVLEAIVTIVVAVIGSGSIVGLYLKHRLDKESERSQRLCDIDVEIDFAKIEEWDAILELFKEIVRCEHGKEPNGQLQAALDRFIAAVKILENLYDKKRILLQPKK